MVNQLKMAQVQTIETLRKQGWSCRRIARELGIDRDTVRGYVRQLKGEESKPAQVTVGSRSRCEAFRSVILEKLEIGLTAQRVFQDLQSEPGFGASYESVKRYVRKLEGATPLPFRRIEVAPGAECQVDFGKGAWVDVGNGKRRRPHLFRIVLSHSRKAYSEVVWTQSTENFIRCLENSFWFFGGVPEILVVDNLKAAVLQADWYDPELNPKIREFARHYGIACLPTKSYTPRHKGKIERGVGYAQDNGLKGKSFASLTAHNEHLRDWEERVADLRIHGTTHKQVKKQFEEVERPALKSLPTDRFPFFHEGQRKVHRDGHIEVERSYYSVPPEYLGHTVWVRYESRMVRVFTQRMELIATHLRMDPGRFSTLPAHLASAKISGVEKGASYLLGRITLIGTQAALWAKTVMEERGIEGVRVLQGLLSLVHRHSKAQIESVCALALSHGAYRLKALRQLLAQPSRQENFEFMKSHPLIRDLQDYGNFVKVKLQKEDV